MNPQWSEEVKWLRKGKFFSRRSRGLDFFSILHPIQGWSGLMKIMAKSRVGSDFDSNHHHSWFFPSSHFHVAVFSAHLIFPPFFQNFSRTRTRSFRNIKQEFLEDTSIQCSILTVQDFLDHYDFTIFAYKGLKINFCQSSMQITVDMYEVNLKVTTWRGVS